MGIKIVSSLVMVVAVVSTLFSSNFAIVGKATYYTNYVPSTCFGKHEQGTMIVAVNSLIYRNGSLCGEEVKVLCAGNPCKSGKSITVRIVDLCSQAQCPTYADIALSKEAFSSLADPSVGIIPIDFN